MIEIYKRIINKINVQYLLIYVCLFDIDCSHEEENNSLYYYENNIDFDYTYPKLPRQGFVINVVVFYDIAFKTACHQNSTSPHGVIEQIFDHVGTYLKDKSLTTMFHVNLIKTIYKSGVIWNKPSENGTEASLKIQNLDNEENADVFVHMGLMNTVESILGKVPNIGRCFSNSQTCSGICSRLKNERSAVVLCDMNNLPKTAHTITQMIGRLLGIEYDYMDKTDFNPLREPRYSMVSWKSCTNINGIMDVVETEYNNLKWTRCSAESLQMYYKRVKEVSKHNTFCLEQYNHNDTEQNESILK